MIQYNEEKQQEILSNYFVSFQNTYDNLLKTEDIDLVDIPSNDLNVLYEFKVFLENKLNDIGKINENSTQKEKQDFIRTKISMEKVSEEMIEILKQNNIEPEFVVNFDKSEKGLFIEDLYAQSMDLINEKSINIKDDSFINKITKKIPLIGKKFR